MLRRLEVYRHYLYMALFFLGSYVFFRYLLGYLTPFVFAAILAFIMDPAVNYLERKGRFPRGLAAGVVLLFVMGVLFFLLVSVFTNVIHELALLSRHLPGYYSVIMELIEEVSERAGSLPIPLRTMVESQVVRGLTYLQTLAETIVVSIRGVPHLVTSTVVGFLAAFFLSKDRDVIGRFILGLLPGSWRQAYIRTKKDVVVSTLGLVKAQAFLILLSTAISIVGLEIIGVPYALVMGLIIGFVDVLPILGPSAIYWPWIIINLILQNYLFALALLALFGIVSLTRSILEPKVIGSRIGVHPLATLFSLYVGFRVFGLGGFIVGPLVAILLKASVRSGLLPFSTDEM
ncbi:MAG: sporulation integral membrane protein YtvI [Bacillota bacterium]